MAIWQFEFIIIPQKQVLEKYDYELNDINSINIGVDKSWEGYSISQFSLEKISKIFTPIKSWSKDINQFGLLEESCIELFFHKNILMEISIRFDLSSLTYDILTAVISFIADNNALILTPNGLILRPIVQDVIRALKESDAYSFLKNPQDFLYSLEGSKIKLIE